MNQEMKNFVNLYVKTEYSLLSSNISIRQLPLEMKNHEYDAMAITDDGMHGVIQFYQTCLNNQVHPIIGLALPLKNREGHSHLVLLYAMNQEGYHHLMELSTISFTSSILSLEEIASYQEGVLAILPGLENEVLQYYQNHQLEKAKETLLNYKHVFNELYMGLDLQSEFMREHMENILLFLKECSIQPVGLHKTSYYHEEDQEVYQTLRSIDLGLNQYTLSEQEKNSYMISKTEANLLFQRWPMLLENTVKIANKCQVKIHFHQYKFPKYEMKDGNGYLEELCKVGLNKRLKRKWERKEPFDMKVYQDRLSYELGIIRKMGFSDYFLIVFDYVRYAKMNDILVGPGRGSAGGSLVSFALGITDIDPIFYGLLFERFLNPERVSMPDIDVDIPDDRRDEVIQYIGKKYGKMRVAHITTFGTMKVRMAVRDVARVLAIDEIRLKEIMRHLPQAFGANSITLQEVLEQDDSLKNLAIEDPMISKLLHLACKIEGLPRNYSTHAAGIIMADGDLTEYTPLQKGMNGLYQTQYEAADLESLGLVKMDILGLRNLTIIDRVLKEIEKQHHEKVSLSTISLEDSMVYKMLSKGDTLGIFQLESDGVRKLLRDLKTSAFMDIVHAVSLYRPGPMEMIPMFIRRKFGEPYQILHPDLKNILNSTYGTIVFQEQIMQIAQTFAGYTLGEADILRRAVSKKKKAVLEQERKKFVTCSIKKGYEESLANQIYDYIEKFADYGFNKSHAVSYSYIAYWMAYLKTHYFPYFMSALMTNSIGSVTSIYAYIMECRQKKLEVYLPSIHQSGVHFLYKNQGIYYSLLGISNVGTVAVQEIIQERNKGKFQSYEDFVTRTQSFLTKRMVTSLIHAGALDEFHHTRKGMVDSYSEILEKSFYQSSLGNRLLQSEISKEEYTFEEMSFYEKEALGFPFKYNLFLPYQALKKQKNMIDLIALESGKKYVILFGIQRIKEIKTKNQDQMAFLDIYDETKQMPAVLFSKEYERCHKILSIGKVYYAEARVDLRNEQMQVILERVYLCSK